MRAPVYWKHAVSKGSGNILCLASGTGDDNARYFAARGVDKNRIFAVDSLQSNLDGLKTDGFVTVKGDIATSNIVDRLIHKTFGVILLPKTTEDWTAQTASTALDAIKILDDSGVVVLNTEKVGSADELQPVAKSVYAGLAAKFSNVAVAQAKVLGETFFIFSGLKV